MRYKHFFVSLQQINDKTKKIMKTKLFLLMTLLGTTAVWAENYSVNTDSELRAAIATNNANITLTADIDLSNRTLEITDNRTVTIDLGGHALDRKLTKRGDNGGQVFTVRNGATLNLSNGTLKGGWGGDGGGLCNEQGGTANLTNITITGCTGDDRGGGISNHGTLTMTGGTVIAKAGRDETGWRAFGPGSGSDDYGKLTIGDLMMVSSERIFTEPERVNGCWYRTDARVEPCTHPGYTADTCPYHKH